MLYSLDVVDVANGDGGETKTVVEDDTGFHHRRILHKEFSTRVNLKDEKNERHHARDAP